MDEAVEIVGVIGAEVESCVEMGVEIGVEVVVVVLPTSS